MKNIVDFPDKAVIDEEAAEWLVRLDGDEPLNDTDRRALAQWLQRSPAHRERLTNLAELWDRLNALTELAVPLAPARPKRRAMRPLLAAAAAVVLVTAGWISFFPAVFQASGVTATNGLYSSAIGEQRTTLLADGSEVFLNTNSQVRVDYRSDSRDIHLLQGEVLFTVSKDPERPFRVHAGGGTIEAIGTAFSVYLKNDSVDITVTEGVVSLSTDQIVASSNANDPPIARPTPDVASSATLSAGQIASLPRFDASASTADAESAAMAAISELRDIQGVEMARRMSWTEGSLIFSGESLEHVVGEISRYTTVKIDFADPEVRSIRVGGVFPVGETAAMFDALESTFGLEVRYLSANRVLISAGE